MSSEDLTQPGTFRRWMYDRSTTVFRAYFGRRLMGTMGLLWDTISQTALDAWTAPFLERDGGPAYDALRRCQDGLHPIPRGGIHSEAGEIRDDPRHNRCNPLKMSPTRNARDGQMNHRRTDRIRSLLEDIDRQIGQLGTPGLGKLTDLTAESPASTLFPPA